MIFWRRGCCSGGDRSCIWIWGGGVAGRTCDCAVAAAVQRWSWHGVVQRLVDIDLDPRVGLFIELRSQRPLGKTVRTSPCDLEIDAMWIVLCPVEDSGTVQCDDLMSEHIASWRDGGWYGYSPAVVRISELVRRPISCLACSSRFAQQPSRVNFVELELRFVDATAGPVATREVVNDGAVVRLGPRTPL